MSCHLDDVFHFQGEPQRCLYCLDPLVLQPNFEHPEIVYSCGSCGLRYVETVLTFGTEHILSNPARYHVERLDTATFASPGPVPLVYVVDLRHVESVLTARGDG